MPLRPESFLYDLDAASGVATITLNRPERLNALTFEVYRELREAFLALLVDLRYSKRQILDAYMNEIYWGRSGSADLMGVGAAAWAYFGRQPSELTLGESATLAGMIQSPAHLSPLAHPEAAAQVTTLVDGLEAGAVLQEERSRRGDDFEPWVDEQLALSRAEADAYIRFYYEYIDKATVNDVAGFVLAVIGSTVG
mgnify:CR=1 FL=1